MPTQEGDSYTVTEWHHECVVCKHKWISVRKRPTHCSNPTCRSRLWFDGMRRPYRRLESMRQEQKGEV